MGGSVGFVGLGAMGLPMTRVLAGAGYRLLVYDISAQARRRAGAVGGVALAHDAAGVAAAADVLFTCVPDDAALRHLYLGEGGLLAGARGDQISIDCSTVSPGITRELSAALAARGVVHLDAAMLGSVGQAETGEIGFLVGGERDAFERAAPLLHLLGRMVKHVGPSGSGHRLKLIHQTLVAGHAVAVAEALALCLATEADIDDFYDLVCNGGGLAYSRYFEKRTPRMRAGDFSPLFTLDFMAKDARLAHDLAQEAGMETPLLERILSVLSGAQAAGHGGADFSAVARVYEAAVGKRLQEH